jgi:hypothetical protein
MSRTRTFLLLTLIAAPGSALADVVFTDSTFDQGNYNQTATFTSDAGVTVNSGQCATCGNPGQALQIQMSFPTGSQTFDAAIGFVNKTFSYNPQTQGAITSISASVDKNIILNFPGNGFGNTFHPMIEQDGQFFIASIPGPTVQGTTTGFNTLAQSGLVAADFVSIDFTTDTTGSGTPNFDGDPILFGLAQLTSIIGGPATFEADYDNLSLDLSTVPVTTAVPEPSTFVLFGLGLAALGVTRRRRA